MFELLILIILLKLYFPRRVFVLAFIFSTVCRRRLKNTSSEIGWEQASRSEQILFTLYNLRLRKNIIKKAKSEKIGDELEIETYYLLLYYFKYYFTERHYI